MTKWIDRAYPFLFAIIPVVRLVAGFPGWADLADVAVILTTVIAVCVVIYGLALLATRRWGGGLAPLILMAAVLGFWVYPRVAILLDRQVGVSHPILLPLWAAATLGCIWWLARRPALLDGTQRFLTLTGAILVAWSGSRSASMSGEAQGRFNGVRSSSSWRSPSGFSPQQRSAEPDIYLIVLDEDANAEVTEWLFEFDIHVFLDSLRQLGFVVPAVHSTYLHTLLSLPSLLTRPTSPAFRRKSVASRWTGLFRMIWSGTTGRCASSGRRVHRRVLPLLGMGSNPAPSRRRTSSFTRGKGRIP